VYWDSLSERLQPSGRQCIVTGTAMIKRRLHSVAACTASSHGLVQALDDDHRRNEHHIHAGYGYDTARHILENY
jgi:hypothetical protein